MLFFHPRLFFFHLRSHSLLPSTNVAFLRLSQDPLSLAIWTEEEGDAWWMIP